ncbi:inositol monophosphatase family protein, partial [Mesorhizobium sp. IMUNJ 23232]|uniref:inositol monophosphatase family protein n=1 Tax=Mesorhizobium sp. IMUNJ 23232 TaxID=3376064 RepID=UPI003796DDD8
LNNPMSITPMSPTRAVWEELQTWVNSRWKNLRRLGHFSVEINRESVETLLNGKPMPSLPPLDLSQASMGIGLHPSVVTADRLEVLRFISDELRISFRCCGSSALSLIEVAMGETDGYVALGDSTWDVMAGLPILGNLGVSHTIDWDRTHLDAKLRFACGSKEFLAKVRPLLESVGDSPMSSGVAHG